MSPLASGRKVILQEKSHLVYVKKKSKLYCESAIGQHLIASAESAKNLHRRQVLNHWLKTQSCVEKSLFSQWDSSRKQWLIGHNWLLLSPIRRTLSHVTVSGYIFRLTFRSLSDIFIL